MAYFALGGAHDLMEAAGFGRWRCGPATQPAENGDSPGFFRYWQRNRDSLRRTEGVHQARRQGRFRMNTATLGVDAAARRRAANPAGVVVAPLVSSPALGVSLLDELTFGVIVIDRTFRATLANALGRTMVERGDCISLAGERLRFLDPATAERFAGAAAQVMGADGSGASLQAAAFRVSRLQHGPDYLASIKRFGVLDGYVSVGSAYCVQLVDAHARRSIAPRFLRQLHGFTATEAIVAAKLYEGMTLQDAALALSISVHTVKTHLKRIFEKCEVRSQVELVRLLEFGPRCD